MYKRQFLGRDFTQGRGYSETIAAEIDSEIRDIVDEAFETARRMLTEHRDQLEVVAQALMRREKLSGEEFKTLMEGGQLPEEAAKPAAPAAAEEPAQPQAPEAPQPVETAEPAQSAEPAEPAQSAKPAQTPDDEPRA